MSKNFVREIDGIYNINKQEFYTNKANDLLSTKEHNYIRKETQEYHCLTDNVKQTKATNVRYTDTTANPNVNYNLLSVDNSQVPKTNTNTISALSLVSALEAKDTQIQELKEEIANLGGESFYGVIYTSSSSWPIVNDGYVTAKTVTPLNDNSLLVEFNFTGKLEWNEGEQLYKAYFDTTEAFNCCHGFTPLTINYSELMTLNPEVFLNGLKIDSFSTSGEVTFKTNGSHTAETISTNITFTLKVTYTKQRDNAI